MGVYIDAGNARPHVTQPEGSTLCLNEQPHDQFFTLQYIYCTCVLYILDTSLKLVQDYTSMIMTRNVMYSW